MRKEEEKSSDAKRPGRNAITITTARTMAPIIDWFVSIGFDHRTQTQQERPR